jgi:TPR repeat protein
MIFARKRRRSGMGFTGILLAGAVLAFTPAGPWLVQQSQTLPTACFAHIAASYPQLGQPLCGGLAKATQGLAQLTDGMGSSSLGDQVAQLGLTDNGVLQQLVDQSVQSLQNVASGQNIKLANQLMQGGGSELLQGSMKNPLGHSSDLMASAGRYLQPTSPSYEPARAVPILQQAAGQGNYGFLAQLSLGNIYAQGPSGVPQNSATARQYFQQAQASLQGLLASNDPMAASTLQALPISPEALKTAIEKAMADLK